MGMEEAEKATRGGLYEIPLALVRNPLAQAASGYAGMLGGLVPGPQGQGAAWQQKVEQALSYQPEAQSSKAILGALAKPAELYTKYVSEPLGSRGAQASPALGAFAKGSAEVLPMLLGARSAKPLTPAEKSVAKARDQGFVMTPHEMGAGPVPKAIAGLSGETRLARLTSNKNAEMVTKKIAKDLGLPKGATLDLDALAQIRKDAGKDYDTIRKVGNVPTDKQYIKDLDAISQKYKSAASSFPETANIVGAEDVSKIVDSLKKKNFETNAAVDLISAMRDKADSLFKSPNAADKATAKALRSGADAIDSQIERHLQASGNIRQFEQYVGARKKIAKSYAAEKALVGDQINPQALGTQVKNRKPLTGPMKEAGEFSRKFERSSQKPSHMPTGATSHDAALALINAIRTGGGSLAMDALTLGARPAARALLGSKPAQYLMDPRTRLGPSASAAAMEAEAQKAANAPK